MKSIVVIYATREGQTRKVGEHIAADLCKNGFDAHAVDVGEGAKSINLSEHDAAVVAASVHMGRHEREMVKFVKRHRDELERLPSVFLSVNLGEAIVERPETAPEKKAKSEADVKQQIEKFIHDTGWHPPQTKAVAGALAFTKYNFFTKFVLKRAELGGNTDLSRDYEYTDWVALDHFVDEFARRLLESPAASS